MQLNRSTFSDTSSFPPGIKNYGVVDAFRLLFRPLQGLEECRKLYGDVFSAPELFGNTPHIVIGNPEGIQELFNINYNLLDTSRGNRLGKPLSGEHSIIHMDGDEHRKERKLLMPFFHKKNVDNYGKCIVNLTQEIIYSWRKNLIFSVNEFSQEISMKVILRVIFGLESGERYEKLGKSYIQLLELFHSPWYNLILNSPSLQKSYGIWTPWGIFQEKRGKIYQLLSQEIDEHQKKDFGDDIISLLLLTVDEEGKHLSKEEISDKIYSLLFAGYENSASSLAWMFYWALYQSDVYNNLMSELKDINHDTDPIKISQLPYLSAVVMESLRIYPSFLFSFRRFLKTPLEFQGYSLPKNTGLVASIYLVHHHPDIYPQSKQFQPERFLNRKFSSYEFIPFGGGNRYCLGYTLVLYKMKLILATVLKEAKLSLIKTKPIVPVRRGFIMSPPDVKVRLID